MDNLPRASSTSNINKNHANQKSSTKDGDVRSNNDDHVKNPINSKSMNMLPSINHKRASTSASAGSGLSEHFHSKHAADRNGVLTAPTKQMHNDGNNGNHSMSHTGLHADNHSPHTLTHAEMHHAAFGGNEAFVNTKELHNRESRSHIQWQDDIARHIITMYATTKVTKPNISKEKREATQHLLSFVDVRKKNEGLGDVNTDIYMDNTNIPSPDAKKQKRKSKLKQSEDDSPQFSSSNLFPVQESEVESKSGKSVDKLRKSIELGHRNVSIENSKRKKKKKKRVNNKISDVSFELDKYDVTNMNQKDGTEFPSSIPSKSKAKKKVSKLDDEVAPELIDALPAQLKNLPESFSKTSKFRTCYVVKNKEGVETIIRGSPKCYPIWFVASGEVNANWEALPNGEAIQAHLSSIYEKGQYEEYIGIVERIVLDLRQGILDRIQHQPLQLGEHGRSCAVSKANLRQLKSVKKGSPAKKDHYGIPLFYMESANTIMKSCDIDPGKNTDISFNRSNSPSQRRSRIRMLNQSNAADGNGHMFGYNSSHSDQNQNGSDMEEQPAPYDYADQILQNSITTTSGEVLNINGLDVTAVQSQHSGYQSPNKLHTPSSNGIRRRKRNESGDELMNSPCNSPNRSSLGSRAGTRVGSGIESPFMNDMPALSPIRGNGTASNTNLSMNFNMSRIASCGDVGTEEFSNERSADTIPPMEGDLQMIHVQFYWKQLIATAIAMSILSTNKKDFVCALRLLQKAMSMCKIEGFLEDRKKIEMEGYVYSAMAYYFFKCGKKTAALAHTKQAGKLHAKIRNYDSVAISLLHVSVIEIQQSRFKEAHKTLYEFLALIEDGKLAFAEDTATPEQLCIVAICYHNLAIVQLKLEASDLACKSIMNARKIARLCLSYSNRWLSTFQWTYDICVEDVKFQLATKHSLSTHQYSIMSELTSTFFDPFTDEGQFGKDLYDTAGAKVDREHPSNFASGVHPDDVEQAMHEYNGNNHTTDRFVHPSKRIGNTALGGTSSCNTPSTTKKKKKQLKKSSKRTVQDRDATTGEVDSKDGPGRENDTEVDAAPEPNINSILGGMHI